MTVVRGSPLTIHVPRLAVSFGTPSSSRLGQLAGHVLGQETGVVEVVVDGLEGIPGRLGFGGEQQVASPVEGPGGGHLGLRFPLGVLVVVILGQVEHARHGRAGGNLRRCETLGREVKGQPGGEVGFEPLAPRLGKPRPGEGLQPLHPVCSAADVPAGHLPPVPLAKLTSKERCESGQIGLTANELTS